MNYNEIYQEYFPICMLSASCVLQSITFDVYVEAEEPSDCYMISASAFGAISEKVPIQ